MGGNSGARLPYLVSKCLVSVEVARTGLGAATSWALSAGSAHGFDRPSLG